jgi:hypothetical protein
MSKTKGAKSGGGKLSRTETVTVRLDPRLRYLAEIAARAQRRTLSSFIEWSVEQALNTQTLDGDGSQTVAEEAKDLWDIDALDRFAKLASRHPHLLTHEEQVKWKEFEERQIDKFSVRYTSNRLMGGVGEVVGLVQSMRANWNALVEADGLSDATEHATKAEDDDLDDTNLETG